MGKKGRAAAVPVCVIMGFCAVAGLATDSEMYFSSDKNGQHRVTNIQEGDEIWIVVLDNDQNIDCDIRDKMSPDLKILDPKTGAYIVWNRNPAFDPEHILAADDYLEETGADTGVFVSVRSFQVGTRLGFAAGEPWTHTHVVDVPVDQAVDDFQWGHYMYVDEDGDGHADNRSWAGGNAVGTDPEWHPGLMDHKVITDVVPPTDADLDPDEYMIGRFENMDTLIGMYQDPNDATDVAVAMGKIIDTEATIYWGQEIYKDADGAAKITVIDPDENLSCNEVETVPVFIIVNPGSWNPVDEPDSATNFCMLKRTGGVCGNCGAVAEAAPMRWYNIYNAHANAADPIGRGTHDGRYYLEYPTVGDDNAVAFATTDADGLTAVSFYAQETGVNTGVFQLNLNSILIDLGFEQLSVRDVLVAYYLDPNDFDDFKLATAYIEERQHSVTAFTDANRVDKDLYWIGRDPVYVQVDDANANVDPCCPEQVVVHICDPHGEDDAEWLILDETSSNSPVFFTFSGTQLWPVWDALGVGLADSFGGFQLQLDNWKLEAFNEDDIYARYNDVVYGPDPDDGPPFHDLGLARPAALPHAIPGLADLNTDTAFPPWIERVRVANDVSFDLMSIADTQVFDGGTTNMWFLDRQGHRVSGYVNSDCVFIEVLDPDQDEDRYRRERVDGWWDEGQNVPFGPETNRDFGCVLGPRIEHTVNPLLGDTSIFYDAPAGAPNAVFHFQPKLYVLNPRSGFWAAVDLLETGIASGDFVSVICIDLVNVYECVPSLRALPGDTIVAFYQDPSNHSDNAMISIKVGVGGGSTLPSQRSYTAFVDSSGNEVASYAHGESIYVKVVDASHAGESMLADAVDIDGARFDITPLEGAPNDTFITAGIDLGCAVGVTVVAEYTDPSDLMDTSSDSITIVAGDLVIDEFYAGPSPFDAEVAFGLSGTGIASHMTVVVHDLSGKLIWEMTAADVSEIVWDGMTAGQLLANGAYIYVITATDGTNTYTGKGSVFIVR